MTEKEERISRTDKLLCCQHNFKLIKVETTTNLYKCSWCGMKRRENKIQMKEGDKVKFTGHKYAIAQIFNYADKFKDQELVIEKIIKCPCQDGKLDQVKFEGIEGYYRTIFFTKIS